MKLIQASDLHLSDANEREYCLSVLDEIFKTAKDLSCEGILFCGDIFDTFSDLEKLRTEFVSRSKQFPGKIYFLPGNHECLRKKSKGGGYSDFDWGDQIFIIEKEPYQILKLNDLVEILGIPHQESYGNLLTEPPQGKSSRFRIGMAHAVISGMSFTGFETEEEGGGVLDSGQLQSLGCDYVAVGHIHRARSQRFGDCWIAYAGSSRVWRKGEFGKRGGYLLEVTETGITKTDLEWKSAGQYREIIVSLLLDGKPEKTPSDYLSSCGPSDWVRMRYSGYVETMSYLKEFEKEITEGWSTKLRIVEFDSDQSEVKVLKDLGENQFIRRFLDVMDGKRASLEPELWNRAKLLGLELLTEGKR